MAAEAASGVSAALIDQERLTSFIQTIEALREELPVRAIERIGRGQSNLTFRLHLANRTLILRRPPSGPLPPKAHDVLREYRVMQALAGSPVPIPHMFAVCRDPAVLGVPFYLMEDLPGDAIRFTLPPSLGQTADGPHSVGMQVVEALAALHIIDPPSVGLADLSKPTGYIERQVRLWKGQLDYARVRPVPDLDWVSQWLERTMPPDVERSSIVHGDFKLDNVLFSLDPPPRLLAVVDWEMAALGDPLADLGWLLAFWCEDGTPPAELTILPRITEQPEFSRRAELADRYAECTAGPLPNLSFYMVLALWKMAILLEAHWARHVRGTAGPFDFTYLEAAGPRFAAYICETAQST